MRLLFPQDVPRVGIVQTFRHSRISPLITLVLVGGGTVTWTILFPLSDRSEWSQWLPTLLGVLMSLVVMIYVRKSLRPANWLLRVTEDGVYIKFRSYLNEGLPESIPTVVFLPYSDIDRIRPTRRTITVPDREGGNMTNSIRLFEIDLNHYVTESLSEAVRADRALEPIPNGPAKHHDYPLRVVSPGRLELVWKASPGIKKAAETLRRYVDVDDAEVRTKRNWSNMDDAEKEAMIAEFAELGERMKARKLAEQLYDLEKKDAKTYVDALMGRIEP